MFVHRQCRPSHLKSGTTRSPAAKSHREFWTRSSGLELYSTFRRQRARPSELPDSPRALHNRGRNRNCQHEPKPRYFHVPILEASRTASQIHEAFANPRCHRCPRLPHPTVLNHLAIGSVFAFTGSVEKGG